MKIRKCVRCGFEGNDEEYFQPHYNYNAKGERSISYLNTCRKCTTKQAYKRFADKKYTDPVKYYTEQSWRTLNQRCVNGKFANSPSIKANNQHISYHKKGIELHLTKDELKQFWTNNVELVKSILTSGGTPTLDRIDDTKHYEIGNIQVLDRMENIHKSRGYAEEGKWKPSKEQKKIENARRYRNSHKKKNTDGDK